MDRTAHFSFAGASLCPSADAQYDGFHPAAVTTRDHTVIRQWADGHRAVPATGEATASGPVTVSVTDGGTGLRFNFPGMARFRPISWDEWLAHFDAHRLTFIYEEAVADTAGAFCAARGRQHGADQGDCRDPERQPRKPAGASARYRLVQE